MAFPAGLQLVSVHGRFDTLPLGGASGTVRFTSSGGLYGAPDNSIVPYVNELVSLDASGEFTVALPATNDPGWTPVDRPLDVVISTGTRTIRGTILLDYQTPSVEFADLFQPAGAAEAGVTYATLAQLAAVQTDLDAAEASIVTNTSNNATLTSGLATATTAANLAVAGNVRATDHSLVGWTYDPTLVQAGTVQPTAGLAQVARIRVLTTAVANIHFHFTAGGSGLTGGFAALYNDAGALLGGGAVTADQSASWATGGFKTCALSVAQGVTQYAWYRVLWWFTGTTGPTISRAVNSSSAIVNAGLSSGFRYSTADTGLTTTPPGNIGAQTGGATAWWVGLS